MTELMDQLKPIAEILGPNSVKAEYSQSQWFGTQRSADGYSPGWKVSVDGTYRGAKVTLEHVEATLDEAAAGALSEVKRALGL